MKHLDAPFFKTSIFRLTALYVIIFTFSVSILFAVVGYVARSSMHAQIAAAVQREATTLADEYDATRGSRAPELIELRLRRGALSYFLLQDANGRRISGNIAPISPEPGLRDLAVRQQLREPAAGDAEDRAEIHNAIGYGVRLSDGTFAFVASDAERITQVEKAILTAFVIGGGVSLLLAVSGGFVLGRGFLRRLEVVNRTSREIMSGRFDARIPVLHRDDELDRLAINLNATFDRVESLMESLAQISSDVAHDLRTPLSRLRQTLELARRTSTNVEEFRAGTEAAINEADDILETFSALLRISQIESGSRKAGFNRVRSFDAVRNDIRDLCGRRRGRGARTDRADRAEHRHIRRSGIADAARRQSCGKRHPSYPCGIPHQDRSPPRGGRRGRGFLRPWSGNSGE